MAEVDMPFSCKEDYVGSNPTLGSKVGSWQDSLVRESISSMYVVRESRGKQLVNGPLTQHTSVWSNGMTVAW